LGTKNKDGCNFSFVPSELRIYGGKKQRPLGEVMGLMGTKSSARKVLRDTNI